MSPIWTPNGRQVDALALPPGAFISPDITKKRVELVRNNTAYREALQKAGKIAGYVDPALSIARGRTSDKAQRSLFRQNEKAEQLMKEKRKNEGI